MIIIITIILYRTTICVYRKTVWFYYRTAVCFYRKPIWFYKNTVWFYMILTFHPLFLYSVTRTLMQLDRYPYYMTKNVFILVKFNKNPTFHTMNAKKPKIKNWEITFYIIICRRIFLFWITSFLRPIDYNCWYNYIVQIIQCNIILN